MVSTQTDRQRNDYDRRTVLRAIPVLGVALATGGVVGAQSAFPGRVPLPEGFQPEGIAAGRGHAFFVGSLDGGAIYGGDLRTGEGDVLVSPTGGGVAVGLSHDDRSNVLFVAGGPRGRALAYDATSGERLATYPLTDQSSFVNDVVVTPSAAYFTDSFRSVLYRIPLGPAGRLPEASAVEEIPLGGDFEAVPGAFNANGIDASPNGTSLLVVNTTTGLLYDVDPENGNASEIDLGGETVTAGDGILLEGRRLYVVRNQRNAIAVVRLDPGATRGELVRSITDPRFDVPTTIAAFGSALYAVNARFGVTDPANASYDVVRVPKPSTLD